MNKNLAAKIRVMEKLVKKNVTSSKELRELDILELLDDDTFTRDQLKIVNNFQKHDKEGNLYAYLMEDSGDSSVENIYSQ